MPHKDKEKRKEYIKNYNLKNWRKIKIQQTEYREKNKKYISNYFKKYRLENKEKLKALNKEYRLKNLEGIKTKQRLYGEKRRPIKRLYDKEYYLKNKSKRILYQKYYYKKAIRQNNVQFRLRRNLRTKLRQYIKSKNETIHALELVGCSIEYLKSYIEKQFQPGMVWENWSYYGWHIDHIIPLSKFNLTDSKQIKEAFHYTNLQPLWAKENMSKGGRNRIKI